MALAPETVSDVAHRLEVAESERIPIEPPASTFSGFDVVDAYAVQLVNVQRRIEAGEAIIGHKVGLTSKAMQEMLGVSEPDYGHIFEEMVVADGEGVAHSRYIWPRVEVEIAFVLAADLEGPGVTVSDVLAATASVAPAIEIIDSRVKDWAISLADTIADNVSSAGVVLGPSLAFSSDLSLDDVEAVLFINDGVQATGHGRDVLGHPAAAVAWLANKLGELGGRLSAGELVMPGSCTKALDVHPGDQVRAEFYLLGSVGCTFDGDRAARQAGQQ